MSDSTEHTNELENLASQSVLAEFEPELLRAFDFENKEVPENMRDISRVRLTPDKLRLSGDGIFFSLQGEGITMGLPTMFLRLHVCNLKCTWCDAYYTWNPNSEEFWTESFLLDVDEVAEQLEEQWGCEQSNTSKRLVITGGEPLLQKELIDALLEALPGWTIEIETNGTVMPTKRQLRECQFNCSPKLSNSDNSKRSRIRPKVLETINQGNTQFKFVVTKETDFLEIETDFLPHIDRDKIVIMPQGVTAQEVKRTAQSIVAKTLASGYRLMTRLHVDLWGAKRRV